ncbi:MAG TPA: Gfo/Idh/MocA family oxidoreductase [Phycisphaerae bacterium]|nr:Gfo/Idh/MocA family oxidoreductase [Phycisphaerae bacterium]HRY67121.1 Gfo/Idh/MocA family oxidoreductase [Phycisphaerae bacterium]HSA26510.1 Gfo/Idh/MocA family oxidoreductase [Phycisphaerae bacterium]
MSSERITRRKFMIQGRNAGLAYAGAAGLAALAQGQDMGQPPAARRERRKISPNDKIRIGLIGANGQGNWNLDQLLQQPDVEVVAVCEVWKDRRDATLAKCGGNAKGYNDFREVLAREDIDAVLIATPPHWHAIMAVAAAEAGKDFYCEKPMTLSVGESLAVVKAAKKNRCVTQVGTQIHATPNYRKIVNIVRSGVLGKICVARTFHVFNQGPEGIGNVADSDPPPGLDWDMWLGPGPKRGFNALLAKDSAHHPSFMAYSGGWTPGMAPHLVDLPFWALELGHPLCATSSGGRYLIRDCGDAYDFQEVLWQFPGFTMTWTTSLINSFAFDLQGGPGLHRRRGIYFQGVNGTIIADYDYLKIVEESGRMKGVKIDEVPKVVGDSPGHHREWLDCIRSRQQASCSVGYHYKIDVAINLAMMSLKLGRSVQFDPATETIPNDREAAKLLFPPYRDPWRMPAEYM